MYSDHRELLAALHQFTNIRYVAYRTAAKLKFLQSQTKLDCVKLAHVYRVVDDFGLRSSEKDLVLTKDELRQMVTNVYFLAQKAQLVHLDHKLSSRIVLNLICEAFDRQECVCVLKLFVSNSLFKYRNSIKKGCSLLDFLVFFTVLCGEATLGEKYRRLLQLISDHNSCIQQRSLALLLKSMSSLPHLVNEAPAFGHWTVLGTVQQCFEQVIYLK